MKLKKLTIAGIGFWIGVMLILVYEFYALSINQGKTISEIVWYLSTSHPIIPLAFGVLMGHFFWQSSDVYKNESDSSKTR